MQKGHFNRGLSKATILILVLCSFFSCSTQQNETQKEYVVCTTNIISDVARVVLPDDIEVISLMGEGVDPHLYKAGHKDLEYLQKAKVIIKILNKIYPSAPVPLKSKNTFTLLISVLLSAQCTDVNVNNVFNSV